MAATNYTPIQLYHSTTASAAPASGNLVNGELAINIADGKLYYKDSGGTVQIIASKGTGTIGGATTQVQYNSSGALAGSTNFTFDGTTATINTLNLTNALGAAYGGTAQSTYAQGDLLYASAANTLAKLGVGLNTYILTSNGTIPGWSAPSAVSIGTATNLAGGAAGSVPYQSGAGVTTFLSIGTVNQVVTSTGSAPQWSSGLSITTLTASDAVTFSATTQNIALGTSQTSGTFTVGGAAQTGTQTIDQSTKTHTLNIGAGATESGATKTVNLATAGVSGSTTTMSVGSAVSGAITNLTVNATTTLAPVARSTGAVSYFTVTTPADTGLTASTEVIGSSFTAATRTWATGALTLQRERVFAAPTYAFAGASTLTTAVNVDIGLPVAGTNATITNAYALRADNTLFTGNVVLNNASAALDLTNLEVTNIKAKDGTAAMTLADTTGIITLSATAGTANGVLYLNGSRAVTSGSALTFDGTNLYATGKAFIGGTADGGEKVQIESTAGAQLALRYAAGTTWSLQTNSGGGLLWNYNGSEQMRLTSTGLGIGTSSPGTKLQVESATSTTNAKVVSALSGSLFYSAFEVARSGVSAGALMRSARNASAGGVGWEWMTTADNTAEINGTYSSRMILDSSGNLGIGDTNPGQRLAVIGVSANLYNSSIRVNSSTGTQSANSGLWLSGNQSTSHYNWLLASQYNLNAAFEITPSTAVDGATFSNPVYAVTNAGLHKWYNGTTQAMTLLANGNLGIGETNPATKLHVYSTSGRPITSGNPSSTWSFGSSSTNFAFRENSSSTDFLTIDSSGNLGLGVTPSAWGSSFKALQLAGGSVAAGSDRIWMYQNVYINSSGQETYVDNAPATSYRQYNGLHYWYTAAASTGNISFTQAMTLDASGQLIVGNTAAAGSSQITAYGASNGQIAVQNSTNWSRMLQNGSDVYIDNGVGGSAGNIIFRNSSSTTERARITSGGVFGVGCDPAVIWPSAASSSGDNGSTIAETYVSVSSNASILQYLNRNNGDGTITQYYHNGTAVGSVSVTSTATAYNTSSDYRLKDNQQPLTGSGAFIDALQPKTWDWKSGGKGVGFIAHEVQEVSPGSVVGEKDAVDADGKPIMQAMEYGSAEFIANIIAELQSLRARVAQLEAK